MSDKLTSLPDQNLPIGGVTLPLIALFLNQQQPPQSKTVTERLKSLDWTGTVVLLGSFVCILLALQVRPRFRILFVPYVGSLRSNPYRTHRMAVLRLHGSLVVQLDWLWVS